MRAPLQLQFLVRVIPLQGAAIHRACSDIRICETHTPQEFSMSLKMLHTSWHKQIMQSDADRSIAPSYACMHGFILALAVARRLHLGGCGGASRSATQMPSRRRRS